MDLSLPLPLPTTLNSGVWGCSASLSSAWQKGSGGSTRGDAAAAAAEAEGCGMAAVEGQPKPVPRMTCSTTRPHKGGGTEGGF